MFKNALTRVAALGLAAAMAVGPAAAQKAKDTIRLAINDPFSLLDSYHFPLDEAGAFYRTMSQSLVLYDEHKRKWVPLLAKSFKRVDERTIEFDLRDDITFHNGNAFDAEDVKATIDYIRDPAVKIRFKARYDWVKQVEIVNRYKVRIHADKAFSTDLSMISYWFRLYDSETLNALENKADYGKTAIATGSYRLVSLDRNKGIVVERVENHWDKSGYFPAPVKRVEGSFIPDRQTQLAQLMTGGVDLMRNITVDDAENLARNQNIAITPTSSSMLMYVTLDAAGRSANKVFTDVRVRKAFMMAIDRDLLVKKIVPGGQIAHVNKAICFPSTIGCEPTTSVYAYNPSEAKRLLIEAGHPNGFDLTIHAHEPIKYIAEAIAGEVRRVGIRASVQPLPISAYTRMRGDGEFTAFTAFFPAGSHPEMTILWDFFFGGDRDYWRDDFIHKVMATGDTEFDEARRTKLFTPALDRVNEQAYILPVSELPIVWAHNKDIVIKPNPWSAAVPILGDYGWKK